MQRQFNNSARNKELAYLGARTMYFSWIYRVKEICLIIEGEAKIKTESGESYLIKSGDLVEFHEGLSCEWQIIKSFKKHFRLGE